MVKGKETCRYCGKVLPPGEKYRCWPICFDPADYEDL